MPRYRRVFVGGHPHHIVQRGHDRQAVFADNGDYRLYLENLREQLLELHIGLFSYCLMTNHVHLLVEPRQESDDVSRLMRVLAARQTRFVNRVERRSGTLWEGRFKCSVVDSEQYLLACCRYIELNPVRARLVDCPEGYAWSSYRARMGDADGTIALAPLPVLTAHAESEEAHRQRYREYVSQGIASTELSAIRTAVHRNQVTGSARFKAQIEHKLGRRLSDRGRGRPANTGQSSDNFHCSTDVTLCATYTNSME
ncbi:MAG: transposase [Burkholderiales bacterium]